MLHCIFNVPLDVHSGMKKLVGIKVRRKCSVFLKCVHYLRQDLKVRIIDVDIIEPDGNMMVEKPKVPKALAGKK